MTCILLLQFILCTSFNVYCHVLVWHFIMCYVCMQNSISCLKFINHLTVGPSPIKYQKAGPLCQTVAVNRIKNAEFIDKFLQLKPNLHPLFIKDRPDF